MAVEERHEPLFTGKALVDEQILLSHIELTLEAFGELKVHRVASDFRGRRR